MSERIIVERLHGHWSAWFDGELQIAFGGATPAEAVGCGWWGLLRRVNTDRADPTETR